MLSIRNLRVYYHTEGTIIKAVDDVTLDIGRKEIVGLVGESGSGKSTLAKSIVRLLWPPARIEGGEILYNGINLIRLEEEELRRIRGKEIAIIFQNPQKSLNPLLRIEDQVTEIIIEHLGVDKKEAYKRSVEILESVGFNNPREILEKYPHELSGGQQQRVIIAIAIACGPSLLIADEPTSNLDVVTQAHIIRLFYELCREREMSLLFITHHLGLVSELCERVAIMYRGKIVETGSVAEIFREPSHEYTQELLRAVPRI